MRYQYVPRHLQCTTDLVRLLLCCCCCLLVFCCSSIQPTSAKPGGIERMGTKNTLKVTVLNPTYLRPVLVNSRLDVPVMNLVSGSVIDLKTMGKSLNIEIVVQNQDIRVDKVKLQLNTNLLERIESGAPYTLGNTTTIGVGLIDYTSVPELTTVGDYQLVCTLTERITFKVVSVMAISFRVIDSSLTKPVPVAAPVRVPVRIVPTPVRAPTPVIVPTVSPPVRLRPGQYLASDNGTVQGILRKWHKVTIGFNGPDTNETAIPNPFTFYRLDVTFFHNATKKLYRVPGYYAADGNAANTGATGGKVWLVHFAPDEMGRWTYSVSFRKGLNVAQNGGGAKAGYFDSVNGTLFISDTDKIDTIDLRGKGRLEYVGEHYLRFAGNGEYYLKVGADSPENFLAYKDFDNTPNYKDLLKDWAPHIQDYRGSDPLWSGFRGAGILGAINYLSKLGMNVISFLTMNINGDDRNVFPFISDERGPGGDNYQRIDVSKTGQWEIVMEHGDKMGMLLHCKTQERENDQLLDDGDLGLERKLYYRELIARFSHHLALTWNLGEEITSTSEQIIDIIDYFKKNDPYKHPIVAHTWPSKEEKDRVYLPLLGVDGLSGPSLQLFPKDVSVDTLLYVNLSATSKVKWVVTNDEQGPASDGVLPDSADPNHDLIRKQVLWDNLMSNGAGAEYYFGYSYNHSDLTCQDFRSRHTMWVQSNHAIQFFRKNDVPFWTMTNQNSLISQSIKNRCFATPKLSSIVLYLRDGGTGTIDLTNGPTNSTYRVSWYDPVLGGELQNGSILNVLAGGKQNIGTPPPPKTMDDNQFQDWVVYLRK